MCDSDSERYGCVDSGKNNLLPLREGSQKIAVYIFLSPRKKN